MYRLKYVHVVLLVCTVFIFVALGPSLAYIRKLERGYRFRRTVRATSVTLAKIRSNHTAIDITRRNFKLVSVDFEGKHIVCIGKNLEEKVKAFRHRGALAVGVDIDPGDRSPYVLYGDIISSGFPRGSVDMIYCNSIKELRKQAENDKDFVQTTADMLAHDGLLWVDMESDNVDVNARNNLQIINQMHTLLETTFDITITGNKIACRRKLTFPSRKSASSLSVIVFADSVDVASKEVDTFRKNGMFAIAMVPGATRNKGVIACSLDLNIQAFSRIVEIGDGARACQKKHFSCAFVTYVKSPDLFTCAKVFASSVHAMSTYPIIFGLPATMPTYARQHIAHELPRGASLIEFAPVEMPIGSSVHSNPEGDFSFLQMWGLTQYKRIVAIDVSTLVTKSLDRFCELDVPADSIASFGTDITTQFLVLTPSTRMLTSLLTDARKLSVSTGGVQSFLRDFFKEKQKKSIDAGIRIVNSAGLDDEKIGEASKLIAGAHAIHFDIKASPCKISPNTYTEKPVNHVYKQWHSQYETHRSTEQRDRLLVYNANIEKQKNLQGVSGCVLYLINEENPQKKEETVRLLKIGIESLEEKFFSVSRYPICILHASILSDGDLESIAAYTKSQVFTYAVNFKSEFVNDGSTQKRGLQNKTTASFSIYNLYTHPVFEDFDYLLRLKADVGLSTPIPCDPFQLMKAKEYLFGFYEKAKAKQLRRNCTLRLHESFHEEFLPEKNLQLQFPVNPDYVYMDQFILIKTSLVRDSRLVALWKWADAKQFRCDSQSIELSVMPYALSLGLRDEMIHQFSGYGLWKGVQSNKLWPSRLDLATGCPNRPPPCLSCNKTEIMEPPKELVDAAIRFVNENGHLKDPLNCEELSFQKLGKSSSNFRIFSALNEYLYTFVMQTNLGRIFECTVHHDPSGVSLKHRTKVLQIKQRSHYGAASVCSPRRQGEHVPDFDQFCACDDAFGYSTTSFGVSTNQVPPGENLILTSFFTHKKDPQRGRVVKTTFDYIRNFYVSVRALNLNVVLFHTGLPQGMTTKYKTDRIRFIKVHEPEHSMSTNDFRFKVYKDYVQNNAVDIQWILLTDASDVFFNHDPFTYMVSHEEAHALFMSPDIGTFRSNGWMKNKLKKCYKGIVEKWKSEWNSKLHNAGVWGGNRETMECMLKCVWDNLNTVTKGRGNCNMPAVNYCAHFGGCLIDSRTMDDFKIRRSPSIKKDCSSTSFQSNGKCVRPAFVNPFRRECHAEHYIVHNKCTSGKTQCVEYVNGVLVKKMSKPCLGEEEVLKSFGVTTTKYGI